MKSDNLTSNSIPDEFGKEQLKFLLKIKDYESKNELSRFLLIASFGGILSIIAGFMELIFYKFFNTDVIFFQFNLLNNPEPILLLAVWIVTIFPLLIIIIFTSGTSGIINWNKTYRIIGYIAIILFSLSEMTILLIGEEQLQIIPLIWGIYIFIGFLLAGLLMNRLENQSFVAKLLYLLGVMILANSFVSYIILDLKLAMFYMLSSCGIFLVFSACFVYVFVIKYSILENFLLIK
jgi:hypothetical protein